MILKFILLIGVLYQVTSIISESSFPLFRWMRTLPFYIGDLFGCFLCVSVWVGFCGSFIIDIAKFAEFEHFTPIISGLFYSFVIWWIYLLEKKISE